MMLTQVVDHIDKVPTLSARNIAMLRNNAACAEMLYYMSQKKGSDGQAGYKLEEVVKNLDDAMGQVGIEEGAYLSYASNKVLAYLAASREWGKGEFVRDLFCWSVFQYGDPRQLLEWLLYP